ncbi:hypothetical protein [Enterococcus cecorum]|uniref:hypothetical protein n=1 Tax=Enterococcus cecorum TaxID=44008 RepID=UPI000AD8B732|nr:hypothetical protein [Enterococcus cecorum]
MQNRYMMIGIIFMVISILLIVGSIFFQQYLNIFSFLGSMIFGVVTQMEDNTKYLFL